MAKGPHEARRQASSSPGPKSSSVCVTCWTLRLAKSTSVAGEYDIALKKASDPCTRDNGHNFDKANPKPQMQDLQEEDP